MVTSYYIMEMGKKRKNMDIDEYYSNINTKDWKTTHHKNNLTCRICLRDGSLPIYDAEHRSEIVEALQIFGNIAVYENDEFPKHLCKICYKFIKGAISFRKVAKKSDDILKQSLNDDLCDNFQDSHDATDDYELNESEQANIKKQDVLIPTQSIEKLKEKTKTVKVQCYVCNKIVTSSYYKEHITMHDPDHLKYVCDICGKSFRLRCSYYNHSLRHRSDFPFKCQLCPYKGKYAELLKTHMRTHTGDYRYMCTECPARFLFKSNLNRHVLIKHKEPQYNCDSCKRVFHTSLMLQRHHEVHHLGIKNHVCNLCGKAFGYRNAMNKHQRKVHKREKMSYSRMPSYLQAETKNLGSDV